MCYNLVELIEKRLKKVKFRTWIPKNQLRKEKIVFVRHSNVGKSGLIRLLASVKIRIGKRPGTMIFPFRVEFEKLDIVDTPGFGFIKGNTKGIQEKIKDFVIWYNEKIRM